MSQFYQSVVAFAVAVGPSLLMLAAFALAFGGVRIILKGNRQKGVLMIICALVFVGNVLILSL
jgi:hypothetical protein